MCHSDVKGRSRFGGKGRHSLRTENVDQNLYLSARNLPHVAVVDVAAMDPVSLVDADNVLVTVESVKKIEEWLA